MGYADQFVGFKHNWLHSWQDMPELLGSVASGNTSASWPGAMPNDAWISRIWNPEEFEANFAYVFNGTTAGGNIDIGLYTEAGDRIVSTGSTAQVGNAQTQFIAIPDTVIPRGVLLLAMAADSTSVQINKPNFATTTFRAGQLDVLGWAQAQSSMPLPTTLPTLIAAEAEIVPPAFGIVRRWP